MEVVVPTYLPNVAYFAWLLQQEVVPFVANTHYQKQTFRNRTEIYGANGTLILTIPVEHRKVESHQQEKEVEICYASNWQKQHWKSLCAAYRSSPFFEFYEADLYPFYHKKTTSLFEYNLSLLNTIYSLLDQGFSYKIHAFTKSEHTLKDTLFFAKNKQRQAQNPYTQVFENKHGFIPNLSVLDVLFNLGPGSLSYLKKGVYPN